MFPKDARPYCHGRVILRTGLPDDRASRHEVRKSSGNILVGNADLLFERVQFRISEDLPPLAAQLGVLWLGHLPTVHFLQIFGRNLFKGCWWLHARAVVLWTNIAALKEQRRVDESDSCTPQVTRLCFHA